LIPGYVDNKFKHANNGDSVVSHAKRSCALCFLLFGAAGHMECIDSLVAHGGNIDYNIIHLGTPLYVACQNQQIACAKKLLESGKTKRQNKKSK
jgi:hypothetical protein